MPRITNREFELLPFRVHEVLAGVPLHDVWRVDLPWTRRAITLDAVMRTDAPRSFQPSAVVRLLLGVRFLVGRIFGWDGPVDAGPTANFRDRLSAGDRAKSLAPAGTPYGRFRLVYRFENEQLLEIVNRTVHAGLFVGLVEATEGYRLYLAIYVRSVGPLSRAYMALIDPVRRWIVYPSLERTVRSWSVRCTSP